MRFILFVAILSASLSGLAGCTSERASDSGPNASASEPSRDMNYIYHEVTAQDKATAKGSAAVKSQEVVLWVSGMGCPLCASNIDKQLERLPGVETVKVDLGTGKVRVGMDPLLPHPSPARFGDAVEDAGFTLDKIEEIQGG